MRGDSAPYENIAIRILDALEDKYCLHENDLTICKECAVQRIAAALHSVELWGGDKQHKPCARCGRLDRSLDLDFHCSTCYREALLTRTSEVP